MIRLDPHREPRWFDLLPGVRVRVAPMTSAMMIAARRDPEVLAVRDSGQDAELEVAIGKAMARLTILEWEGIGDENGDPVPVTPENVGHLLDIWDVWVQWSVQVLSTFVAMSAEKNASAPLPTGSSAGAGTIAEPATASATTARAS